jgi:hypothetical protein
VPVLLVSTSLRCRDGFGHTVFLFVQKITRDSEPDEPWGSKYEQKGANPMQDPVAIIWAVGLLFPFILLGIFAATGVIDLSGSTR